MIKRLDSVYQHGRKRGDWWKWKIDPFTVDAILLYAHPGHGRRASLYTDYTFAVWHGEELLPIAKAYSGLTDEEIGRLDRWIRAHTKEKFGPVRSVDPVQVFELHFEGIAASPRHKSGIALRFPRIARWRVDKTPRDADSLDRLKELLHVPA
jgi:DNA ligase-1